MNKNEVIIQLKNNRDFMSYFQVLEIHRYLKEKHSSFYTKLSNDKDPMSINAVPEIVNYLEETKDE